MIRKLIIKILKFFGLISDDNVEDRREETIYVLKSIMTDYEKRFYNILKELENEYVIVPQLNLASVNL